MCIGGAAARDSYLSIDAVLDACRSTGAEAIHPGYGFLSENSELSRRCKTEGVVFIGPGEEVLNQMGDKPLRSSRCPEIGPAGHARNRGARQ